MIYESKAFSEVLRDCLCALKTFEDSLEKAIEAADGIAFEPNPPPECGSFTDPRDGRVYRTVKIGGQTWMAENLNFDYAGSKAYNNDPANRKKYGLLYNWETAKKAVPPGWHIPTTEEWRTLVDFAGGEEIAGGKLKAASGWNEDGNGTDEYGFSALPGGGGSSVGNFLYVGYYGYWWSSTEGSSYNAYRRSMTYSSSYVYRFNYSDKSSLLSVRCVRDAGEAV